MVFLCAPVKRVDDMLGLFTTKNLLADCFCVKNFVQGSLQPDRLKMLFYNTRDICQLPKEYSSYRFVCHLSQVVISCCGTESVSNTQMLNK